MNAGCCGQNKVFGGDENTRTGRKSEVLVELGKACGVSIMNTPATQIDRCVALILQLYILSLCGWTKFSDAHLGPTCRHLDCQKDGQKACANKIANYKKLHDGHYICHAP